MTAIIPKSVLKKHLLFVIMLLVIAAYLGAKTLPEDGWDGWSQGSAQALTTIKHWSGNGFIYNKFLQIPTGYSKIVRYLDEPEMKQHAHGTIAGGLVGQRLYYTHYPSFSLVPPALLMKLGFEKRHWFRLFELTLSLGSLILMYWFFNLISSRAVAFFSVLYYSFSAIFLDFADSIGGIPLGDLLFFAILILSVLALKFTGRQYRYYNFFIWLIYFFLSLTSFDYQFFIFVWLVGLDIIVKRKFLWKKWLFFASAPVLAFLLLLVQNFWYFGNWREVFLDFYGASKDKGMQITSLAERRESVFYTLFLMSGAGVITRTGLWGAGTNNSAALLALTALMGFYILRKSLKYSWPSKNILILLFLSGAVWPFLAKAPAHFEYQGRQMGLFLGLLIGSGTVFLIYRLKKIFLNRSFRRLSFVFILLAFSVISLWFVQIKRTIFYIKNWPNNIADSGMIEGLKNIKSQYQVQARGQEIAFFVLRGYGNSLSENIIGQEQRYPQISPITEYYADAPILSFSDPKDLVKDFIWLKKRSEYDFFPIILLPNNKELIGAIQKEIDKGLNEL